MSATSVPTINNRRQRRILPRGEQRREAFRLNLHMPVHVDEPMELFCELSDISFTGVGLDVELPCRPGTEVSFLLEFPTYGGVLVPTTIALQAEVMSVERGHTGLRFVDLDREQSQAIRELVTTQQRIMLVSRRSRRCAIVGPR